MEMGGQDPPTRCAYRQGRQQGWCMEGAAEAAHTLGGSTHFQPAQHKIPQALPCPRLHPPLPANPCNNPHPSNGILLCLLAAGTWRALARRARALPAHAPRLHRHLGNEREAADRRLLNHVSASGSLSNVRKQVTQQAQRTAHPCPARMRTCVLPRAASSAFNLRASLTHPPGRSSTNM